MSPVAADTMHSASEENNAMQAAADVIKGATAAAEDKRTSAINPTSHPTSTQDMPEMHAETNCEGAYCDFVIPDKQQVAAMDGKDTAGILAATPITAETASTSTSAQDLPELHTETNCEGAYCDIVIPKKQQPMEASDSKDPAGIPGVDPTTPETAPTSTAPQDLPEMHTETNCEGAYCDFVVPDKQQIDDMNGKDAVGVPATNPAEIETAFTSTPAQDLPELHAETNCEGAYCDIVIPHKHTHSSDAKDTPGAPASLTTRDPNPASAPNQDMPELHEDTNCEGAYCDIVIPKHKTEPSAEPTENAKST